MGFLFETICKKGFIDCSQSVPDVGGQHCPCPVLVSFVSGLAEKSCPVPVYCPDCVRIFCPISVCPEFVCLNSVSCLDSVRIFEKICTLPACLVSQGRARGVRTFDVLVCRRLVGSGTNWSVPVLELGRTRTGNFKMHAKMV